ncbi:MAG: YbaY family lipoprotein [Acidobacteria bacterium]|nr:YbaY family lipoprotein [Acidobacteriota bacterium]
MADTSVTDAAAGQIGAHVIEQPKTVPVGFSVGFDPADIIDNHSYTVEATISSGDALLWTTDTAYPVITRGNPLTADLLLIAVPSSVDQ